MSISHFYANTDKRQYFDCGIFGWDNRFRAIGLGPGARALAILLSERGTWRNDRISVVAETDPEFGDFYEHWLNIEIEAELMLLDVDGFDWLDDQVHDSTSAFLRLCDFAIYLRDPLVTRYLDGKFGVGNWNRRYRECLKHTTYLEAQKAVDAGIRQLKILA